jgi:hypothetical protein
MTNAEIERRILDQAYDSAERTAAAAGGADDARRALAALRQRHREIAAHVPSIKIVYEGAVKTIEDPVAKVTELTSKFGSLQQ